MVRKSANKEQQQPTHSPYKYTKRQRNLFRCMVGGGGGISLIRRYLNAKKSIRFSFITYKRKIPFICLCVCVLCMVCCFATVSIAIPQMETKVLLVLAHTHKSIEMRRRITGGKLNARNKMKRK